MTQNRLEIILDALESRLARSIRASDRVALVRCRAIQKSLKVARGESFVVVMRLADPSGLDDGKELGRQVINMPLAPQDPKIDLAITDIEMFLGSARKLPGFSLLSCLRSLESMASIRG